MPKDSRRTRALQGRDKKKRTISKYAQKIERDGLPLRVVSKPILRQTTVPPLQAVPPSHTPVAVSASGIREGRGVVLFLGPTKKHGFIRPADGDQSDNKNNVFFHTTALAPGHIATKGATVSFKAVMGEQGWKAIEVRSF